MTLTLGFDTSGSYCAAALLHDDAIIAYAHEDMAKGQAERLMPLLEELLTEAGFVWQDITRIGVGIGPGNFTGIRISVSAARGLALSLGIPAIGVGALEAQVYGHDHPEPILSLRDARQGRLYAQAFARNGTALDAPVMCEADDLTSTFTARHLGVVGHDSAQMAERLNANALSQTSAQFFEAIARIAAARVPDGTRPAPLYLRPADAAPPRDPAPVIL